MFLNKTGGRNKKMKKNKHTRACIAVFGFFVATLAIFSDSNISSALQAPPKNAGSGMVLANVNMRDAKIEKQEKNVLTISFNISNDFDKVQPGILLRASLQKKEKDSLVLVDEKIIGGEFTLEAKEKSHREITYAVPEVLQGQYEIWINAQTAGGLPLSLLRVGETAFSGTNDYVEIINSSCFLKVKGESGEKKYTLLQGVDIEKNETLQAVCEIMNHSDWERKFDVQFQTYQRNTFGLLLETFQKSDAVFVLRPKEKKQFIFDLPKAKDPQAYDIKLTLLENKKITSNSSVFHFVLRGASATIQSLQMDKQSYMKGESAKASLIITGPADNFPDTRHGKGTDLKDATLWVKIQSGETLCGQTQKNPKLDGLPDSIDITMAENCLEPTASVILKDSAGNTLAERNFFIGKNSQAEMEKAAQLEAGKENGKNFSTVLIFFVILLAILLAVYVLWRIKKKSSIIFPILFLGLGLAISFHMARPAKALTLGWIDPEGMWTPYAVGNIDKSVYYPGETIVAYGWATGYAPCSNAGISWAPYPFTVEINGRSFNLYTMEYNYPTQYAYGTAQSVPGSYYAIFTLQTLSETGPYVGYEFYTVIPRPVPLDGQCGWVAPSCGAPAGVCNVGSPSATWDTGTGYWNWNCSGVDGGNSTTCSAVKDKIDGKCGSVKYTCISGVAVDLGETDAGWSWSCDASCNGIVQPCFVPKVPTPGQCGSANGDPPACSQPTNPNELCANSTIPSTVIWNAGAEQWEWTCDGIYGSTVTSPICIEKKVADPKPGSESNAYRCPGYKIDSASLLCIDSDSSITRDTVTSLLPAAWTCTNSCGVSFPYTNLIKEKEDGKCGEADGETVCDNSTPTLCDSDEPASISYPNWNSIYEASWTCPGSCEGTPASCSAKGQKSCGWIETNP